jgi:hypothetical protein
MRRNAGGGLYRLRAAEHFVEHAAGGPRWRDAVGLFAADDRRDVFGAMVFDLEQIGVRNEEMHHLWVAQQPAARGEDRRRHPVIDQRVDDPHVGGAHAGVERQRHLRLIADRHDMHMRLDQVGLGKRR